MVQLGGKGEDNGSVIDACHEQHYLFIEMIYMQKSHYVQWAQLQENIYGTTA